MMQGISLKNPIFHYLMDNYILNVFKSFFRSSQLLGAWSLKGPYANMLYWSHWTLFFISPGNEATWNKLASESSCWYEYFPGYLFYTNPNCTYYELNTIAEKWLHRWLHERESSIENLKHLDRIVLKIIQNDFYQMLRDIQNIYDHQWFATHLTDLLWHRKLNIFNNENNE